MWRQATLLPHALLGRLGLCKAPGASTGPVLTWKEGARGSKDQNQTGIFSALLHM